MTSELNNHFLNLYSMALADASFDEKEIAVLYKLGEEKGLPKETIDALLLSPPPPEQIYFPDTVVQKMECLYDYARMILADGIVHDDEVGMLEKFCTKFKFQEEHVPTIAQLLIESAHNGISKDDLLQFVTQNYHTHGL